MGSVYSFRGIVGLKDLHDLRQHTEQSLKANGVDAETCGDLVVVTDEWFTNILNHGYQGETGEVALEVDVADDRIIICIRDHGPHFDLTTTPESPVTDFNAPGSKPGGLGLVLIRRIVDRVDYTRSDDGWNQNCFTKLRA